VIPATLIRNDAEQLFERHTARMLSFFVQRPLSYIFVTNTAPDGKPENNPKSTQKTSDGGTPKSPDKNFVIRFSPVLSGITHAKKFDANTNGKSVGTSVVKHMSRAFFE
jgi:hypothetical protein